METARASGGNGTGNPKKLCCSSRRIRGQPSDDVRVHRGRDEATSGQGDVLFVAAGVAHRITAFSDDFAAWVVFYGAVGGELALPPTPGADESDDPRTRNELRDGRAMERGAGDYTGRLARIMERGRLARIFGVSRTL